MPYLNLARGEPWAETWNPSLRRSRRKPSIRQMFRDPDLDRGPRPADRAPRYAEAARAERGRSRRTPLSRGAGRHVDSASAAQLRLANPACPGESDANHQFLPRERAAHLGSHGFGEDHRSRAKADASPGAVLRPPAAWHAPFSPGPRRSPVPDRWRHGRWVGRVREKELIRAAPTRDASGPKAGGSRSPVARKGRLDS